HRQTLSVMHSEPRAIWFDRIWEGVAGCRLLRRHRPVARRVLQTLPRPRSHSLHWKAAIVAQARGPQIAHSSPPPDHKNYRPDTTQTDSVAGTVLCSNSRRFAAVPATRTATPVVPAGTIEARHQVEIDRITAR